MTSDKDELEKALQENLRLRGELGAEARKASGSMAYRLGWVLYWVCIVLAAGWAVFFTWAWIVAGEEDVLFYVATLAGIPSLALYGLGRACRYVLAGE